MKKYTIKDLAEGRCAVRSTGNTPKLNELLALAFSNDIVIASGKYLYYFRADGRGYNWMCDDTTTLPSQPVEDFFVEEKTFPRVMWVNNINNINTAFKRVVCMVKNGRYIAWDNAETLEDANKSLHASSWSYGWELEEKKQSIFPFNLPKEGAHEIINIACSDWKAKLAKLWGADIVLNKPVVITEGFYNEMIKASSDKQKEVIQKIFR